MDKYGVIHGRFQGLHNGHMEYLLAGKARCRHLYIGITNVDPAVKKEADAANPTRIQESSNPFSYFDRYCMIQTSMLDAGVTREEFDILPFPIEFPGRISNFVPMDAVFYITIYDEWGDRKKEILEELGLKTVVMWRRSLGQRLTSGTEIRELIRCGNLRWRSLVPDAVVRYIEQNGLQDKI